VLICQIAQNLCRFIWLHAGKEISGLLIRKSTQETFELVIFHLFESICGKIWVEHLNKGALLATGEVFDEIGEVCWAELAES
jgi:hypothetical protein